ncbi:MAG: hypothetical protein P8J59_11035 [Phycisphaerales bacterium]|nr:hypothetical protein [Phycisphaerales bacterium]
MKGVRRIVIALPAVLTLFGGGVDLIAPSTITGSLILLLLGCCS